MQELRCACDLPCWVAVGDGADRMITADLANPVFADVAADLARKHRQLTIVETFLDESETPVLGPEGRYLHELVVPLHRTVDPRTDRYRAHARDGAEVVFAQNVSRLRLAVRQAVHRSRDPPTSCCATCYDLWWPTNCAAA